MTGKFQTSVAFFHVNCHACTAAPNDEIDLSFPRRLESRICWDAGCPPAREWRSSACFTL